MSTDRVPSGIEGLDALIGGGFQKDKNCLICGMTGTGKTTLGLQFVLKGIELGEAGLYVTIDEKAKTLESEAKSLGFNLRECIDQNKLKLLDFSSHFDQLRRKWPDIDARIVVGEINKYVNQIDAKRLVIDPIGPLVITNKHEWEIQNYIRNLFFTIDELNTTTLLTSIIKTGTNELSQFGMEEVYASGVIVLSIEDTETRRPKRLIHIRKMRGSNHSLNQHVFDFERGKGIVIKDEIKIE